MDDADIPSHLPGTDAAVKDLTFAILISNNNGGINVNANWDKVTETMEAWGYNFTKGAMSKFLPIVSLHLVP